MKKLFVFLMLCVFTPAVLQARTVDVSAAYVGASHFDQVRASAVAALTLNTLAGVEAKYIDDDSFKDPIYAVALPGILRAGTYYSYIHFGIQIR